MSNQFGKASLNHLKDVRSQLKSIVVLALRKCEIDFSVVDGLRTIEEQKENIVKGVSWTMHSKHLPDKTGLAGAVDIYPWVDGRSSQKPDHYKLIAKAMFSAAIELRIRVTWGGFFGIANLDMPHWELPDHKPIV